MAKVICAEDCGNAPKKALLRDFHVAFAEYDESFILESVADDIQWRVIGDVEVQGKEELIRMLEQMQEEETAELIIDNIITHGNTASVNGSAKMANGEAYAFCDVYRFSGYGKNAKIKEMTSYVIALDD